MDRAGEERAQRGLLLNDFDQNVFDSIVSRCGSASVAQGPIASSCQRNLSRAIEPLVSKYLGNSVSQFSTQELCSAIGRLPFTEPETFGNPRRLLAYQVGNLNVTD